jgi:hypothetical protein
MTGWAVGLGLALAGLVAWSAAEARRDPRASRGAVAALRGIGAVGLAALALLSALTGAWAAAGVGLAAAVGVGAARVPRRVPGLARRREVERAGAARVRPSS